MILVDIIMLTSTPALARQALDSFKLSAPRDDVLRAIDPVTGNDGNMVALGFGLGLWNVAIDVWYDEWEARFADVDLVAPFAEGGAFERFSFSRLNNHVAREVEAHTGPPDFFLFVNDDVCARPHSRWIEAMINAHYVAGASQVGIKLVYPPGTKMAGRIQHAGHYRGADGTGVHRGLYADPGAPAFCEPPFVETWAVTGACFLVRPKDFWIVGGFDNAYRTLWQDVELSLSLRHATGRPVVCVQDEWLWHFEGATQGTRFDDEPWWLAATPDVGADRERFLERWPPWKDATP